MIEEKIKKELTPVLQKMKIPQRLLELEHPLESNFGDFSTNIALKYKKKGFANPFDLANEIVCQWRKNGLPEWIAQVNVESPGFINLKLSKEFFISEVGRVLKMGKSFGSSQVGKGKTVVVDYSSPNIARPFGVGHLRSTVIGQALYNLYHFLGYKTVGINHLGDWGTQFGKLIVGIKRWNKRKIESLDVETLEKLYVKFHKEAEKRPKLEEEARAWFKKLEEGDREAKEIWQACVAISLKEFDRVYQLLDIKIDHVLGESFYEDKMDQVIADARRKHLAVKSKGALVVFLEDEKMPPALLLKSDGATTYITRDLASIVYRQKRWKPVLLIYEVGADQKLHFRQVFTLAVKLGYGKSDQFVHVAHGLILFPEGKMSTRRGKTVHLEEVLRQAIGKARLIIKKSQTNRSLNKKKQEEVSRAVGVAAIKYFDLSHHPTSDIRFDWEKMFVLEGDSAPYLLYSLARAKSVLTKAEIDLKTLLKTEKTWELTKEEEMTLLRILYRFPEVVDRAAGAFTPNLLCGYLFDLASKFNLFYSRVPILSSTKRQASLGRLALTGATAQVLENGLNLLGIKTLERM